MGDSELTTDWSVNANEAVTISLVRTTEAGEVKPIASFKPKFTYPIFGDNEQIFGYQGLKINLRFNATDMRPNFQMSCTKKFDSINDTEATDVRETLKTVLPPVAFLSQRDYIAATKALPEDWTPPGTLIKTLENDEGPYEIWKGSVSDPAVRQLLDRIDIMVLFYIEGGSLILSDKDKIKMDDDGSLGRWTVFFMYQKKWVTPEKDVSRYTFVGYSTVYRFHMFIPPTPRQSPRDEFELPKGDFSLSELPCRTRISQFLILPPFLHKGNGARLYSTIFQHYLAQPTAKEITVEDPNEAFDDLRDTVDLQYLRTIPKFNDIEIDMNFKPAKKANRSDAYHVVDVEAVEKLRLETKIAPRQFSRLVEMNLMSKLPISVRPQIAANEETDDVPEPTEAEKKQYRLWKQLVKARIYRHNMDALMSIDKGERIQKLDETQQSVEFEYARLLSLVENRAVAAEGQKAGNRESSSKKRLLEPEEGASEASRKKARVENGED